MTTINYFHSVSLSRLENPEAYLTVGSAAVGVAAVRSAVEVLILDAPGPDSTRRHLLLQTLQVMRRRPLLQKHRKQFSLFVMFTID